MYYAYIRISTDHQHIANQKHEISTFAKKNNIKINKWIEEVISSRKKLDERKLGEILKVLKPNDVIIATELSRLGRNLLEVMGILQNCLENECQVWTLKENYRLGTDIQSKVLAFAFSLAGEIERQLISERTRNSLKRLKDEGKHLGRPHSSDFNNLKNKHEKIKQMLNRKTPKAEIARVLGCSWITLHRYVKKVRLE